MTTSTVLTASSPESLWEAWEQENARHDYKIEILNFSGNLGRELAKEIYRVAYRLEAEYVVIHKTVFNQYVKCDLLCDDGMIAENYSIAL